MRKLAELESLIEKGEHVAIEKEKIVALRHEGRSVQKLGHLVKLLDALYRFVKFYLAVFRSMRNKEKAVIRRMRKAERAARRKQ